MNNRDRQHLKVVPQYIKNVTNSAKFVAKDLLQSLVPNTYDFTSSNSDIFKAVSSDIRNHKTLIKRTKSLMNSADITKDIKEIKKNFFDDLKSGNLYNQKRISEMENKSLFGDLGLGLDDFNFDGFDPDELDFGNTDSTMSTAEKVQSKASMLSANAISQNTNATIQGFEALGNITISSSLNTAKAITENQNSINTMNMINTQSMFSQVNSVLTDIANSLRSIDKYSENMTTYFNQATKDNENMSNKLNNLEAYQKEFIEMQRNLYKDYNKSLEYTYIKDKNGFAENTFDVADYFASIKKNAKEVWESSPIGAMIGLTKSMSSMGGGGMLDEIKASPGKYLINTIFKLMLNKKTKDSFANFDDVLQNFMSSGMLKLSSTLKQKGETNTFFDYLYKIFGLDLDGKVSTKTNLYVKGPIPYNGYANKAIVDVIPTYLRKILSAITGQKEMIYNYKNGKFSNEEDVRKDYKVEEDSTYSSVSFDKYKVQNRLSGLVFNNKEDNKRLQDRADEIFKMLIDKGFFYDPYSVDADKLRSQGVKNLTDDEFRYINAAFKSLSKKELMEMNNNIISGINRRKNGVKELSAKLSENGFSALFDNSLNESNTVKASMINSAVDDYNKTIFDYLRDIRSVLVAGIKVFPIKGWRNRRGGNVKPPDLSNAEALFQRYKSEVKINTNNSNQNQNVPESELQRQAKARGQAYLGDFGLDNMSESDMISKMQSSGFGILESPATAPLKKGTKILDALMKTKLMRNSSDNVKNFMLGMQGAISAPELFVVTALDKASNVMLDTLYKSKIFGNETLTERFTRNLNSVTDKVSSYIYLNIVSPLQKAIFGKDGLIPTIKKRVAPLKDRLKQAFAGIKDAFISNIGTKYFGKAAENMTARQILITFLKPKLAGIGLSGGIGALLGLATPLGLFGSTLMGTTIGLVGSMDSVKNKLFGELGDDNKRHGGWIPEKFIRQFDGALKPFGKGLGMGSIVGLITPLGLFGSALMGGVIGVLGNMSSVKDTLFGKEDANGNRNGGWIKKAWMDKFKSLNKDGNLVKSLKRGLIGSFFLPGGVIGGAVLGLASSIVGQSDRVQEYLFGKINPSLNKRQGGLFGKFKLYMKYNLLDPIVIGFKDMKSRAKYFVRKNIVIPFLDALAPLKEQLKIFGNKLREKFDSALNWFKSLFGNIFKKIFGFFSNRKKKKEKEGKQGLLSKMFGGIGKVVGGVLTLPIKFVTGKANKDVLTDEARKQNDAKTAERLRKAEADRQRELHSITDARDKSISRRKILEDNKYSEDSVNRILTLNDAEKAFSNISEINGKIVQNTSKMSEAVGVLKDTGKDILTVIKDTAKDVKNISKEMANQLGADARRFNRQLKAKTTTNFRNRNRKNQTSLFSSNAHLGDSISDIQSLNAMGFNGTDDGEAFFSHASGIDNVPNDDYKARLHKGEMVIPADQANFMRNHFGMKSKQASGAKGPMNSNNRFVNSISDLTGMQTNGLLTKIYNRISDVYELFNSYLNDKKVNNISDDNSKSPSGQMRHIRNRLDSIYDNIDGQILNVGYNVEYIRNILIEQFGKPKILPSGARKVVHRLKTWKDKLFTAISKPFKWIQEKFGFVADFFANIKNKIKNFIDLPKRIVNFVKDKIKNIVSGVKAIFTGIVSGIKTGVKEVFGLGKKLVLDSVDLVKSAFKMIPDIVSTIGEFAKQSIKAIGGVIGEFGKGLGKALGSITQAAGTLIKNVTTLAVDLLPKIVSGIGAIAKPIWGFIKGTAKGAVKGIGKLFSAPINAIGNAFTKKVEITKFNDNRLYKRLDKIITLLGGTPDITDYAVEQAEKGAGKIKGALGGIKDKFNSFKANTKDNFKNMKDDVKERFKESKILAKTAFVQGMSEVTKGINIGKNNVKNDFSKAFDRGHNAFSSIKDSASSMKNKLFSLFGFGKNMLGNKAGIVKDDASNLKRGILGIPGRIKDSITNKLNQRKEKKGLTQTQLFKSKEKSEAEKEYIRRKRKYEIPSMKASTKVGKIMGTFFSKKGLFGLIAVAGLALLPLAIQKISEIKSKGGLFSWLLDKAGTFITNTVPKIVSGVGTAISKGLDWFINNKDKIGNFIKDTLADFSEWFATNALPKVTEIICSGIKGVLGMFFPFLTDGDSSDSTQSKTGNKNTLLLGHETEGEYEINNAKINGTLNYHASGSDAAYGTYDNPQLTLSEEDQKAAEEETTYKLSKADRTGILVGNVGYWGNQALKGIDAALGTNLASDYTREDYISNTGGIYNDITDKLVESYIPLANLFGYWVGNKEQKEKAVGKWIDMGNNIKNWFNDNIKTPIQNVIDWFKEKKEKISKWFDKNIQTPLKNKLDWLDKKFFTPFKNWWTDFKSNIPAPIKALLGIKDNTSSNSDKYAGTNVTVVGNKIVSRNTTGNNSNNVNGPSIGSRPTTTSNNVNGPSIGSRPAGNGPSSIRDMRNAGNGTVNADDTYNGAVYFRQGDDRWGQTMYGTASIAASGCGPTAMAMLLSSLTGKGITPDETAAWSVANGYRYPGQGTAFGFFPAIGQAYGINMTATEDYDGALMTALRQGYPAILSGRGDVPFTRGGHLLMAVGADPNNQNNVIINDPVSKERSRSYPISELKNGLMQAWIADKKLDGTTVSNINSTNSSTSSTSTANSNDPVANAFAQLASLTKGLITSTITGTVFDPNSILNPQTDNASGTADSSGAVESGSSTARKGQTINIPDGLGKVRTYMGWQCITAPDSTQYQLRQQAGQNFDSEGYGKINGRYTVATTTTYGDVGDYIDVKQSDGSVVKAIIADTKNQNDEGCNKWGHMNGQCVLEYVVDKNSWYSTANGGSAAEMHSNPGTANNHPEWSNLGVTSITNQGSYFNAGNGFGELRNAGNGLKQKVFPRHDKLNAGYGLKQKVFPRHDKLNAGYGFGLMEKFKENLRKRNAGKGVDSNEVNKQMLKKYNKTQDFILQSYSSASDSANNYITAEKVAKSYNYNGEQLSVIIDLLSKIVDNTEATADNTGAILEKGINVNVNQNINNENNNTNVNNNGAVNNSNTLGKISESVNGGAISEAYKKAIMMAQGIME